ncbi:MAG: hypothetical protein ACOCRO_00805 [Halanaerobiales bacterium]
MNFFSIITEASQEAIQKIEKMENYFTKQGDFKEIYPKEYKMIHHVRRENYVYNRGGKQWYGVLLILKDKYYKHQAKDLVKIIKDLEIVKDNNAKVERNNLIIKVLIPESEEIE